LGPPRSSASAWRSTAPSRTRSRAWCFDLRSDTQPWIGRDVEGLLIRFDGDGSSRPAAAAASVKAAGPAPRHLEPAPERAAVASERAEVAPERTEVAAVTTTTTKIAGEPSLGSQLLAARAIEIEDPGRPRRRPPWWRPSRFRSLSARSRRRSSRPRRSPPPRRPRRSPPRRAQPSPGRVSS
jgi:hypothetical protein